MDLVCIMKLFKKKEPLACHRSNQVTYICFRPGANKTCTPSFKRNPWISPNLATFFIHRKSQKGSQDCFFFLLLCQLCHPQIDCLISNPHWWCTEAKLQFKKLHYENSNLETERFVLHFSLYCHCRQPCTSYALKIEAICLNQCTTTDQLLCGYLTL